VPKAEAPQRACPRERFRLADLEEEKEAPGLVELFAEMAAELEKPLLAEADMDQVKRVALADVALERVDPDGEMRAKRRARGLV
jgi:hypothetical protein